MKPRSQTTQEVCKRLRCHPQTLRKLRQKGKIKAYQVGTHWRFTEQSILDFEANQQGE